MKILMVARRYPPDVISGTETVFANLYAHARSRHQVRLVVGYRRERSLVPPEAAAVDLRGASTKRSWARLWKGAMQEVRRFKPDVILSNSIEAPAIGAPSACIVHDLNFGVASRSAGTVARELFYRAKSKQLKAVITVSSSSQKRLIEVGVDPARIHVIHNGVDLSMFTPITRDADPRVRFAYPSRILPGKGQHLAVDAIARLHRRLKDRAHLDVVGAASDPLFVDQLKVQAYGQPVEIHTDVPEIAPFYQRADVVLYPTLMEEGFGFTAIEAMACGKPVIWSDQPAIREATGGIGFPFPQGDVEAMRAHMETLIEDPELRARVGEEGRAFVVAHYDWAGVWERYERVLQGIAQ